MIAQPLAQLLQKGVDWKWTSKQTDAFKQLKQLIVSALVLTHYDQKLPVVLDADASAYGIGAVISHVFPNGEKRPIAYNYCLYCVPQSQACAHTICLQSQCRSLGRFSSGDMLQLYCAW